MLLSQSRDAVVALAVLTMLSAGCAYPKTHPLQTWDLNKGYRFPLTGAAGDVQHPKNSEQLFVVLAFSGGGTRAAALSYGVLHELERVRFHWNEQTGTAEPCGEGETRCRSLLDEDREHLHILDGGLADNVGVRAALRSLSSIDAPMDAAETVSGWSRWLWYRRLRPIDRSARRVRANARLRAGGQCHE